MTRGEAEAKRRKAVEFLRRMGRDNDADRFDAMDARDYAAHKGAELLPNPYRRQTMARQMNPTAGELTQTLEEIADLAEEALAPNSRAKSWSQKSKSWPTWRQVRPGTRTTRTTTRRTETAPPRELVAVSGAAS